MIVKTIQEKRKNISEKGKNFKQKRYIVIYDSAHCQGRK